MPLEALIFDVDGTLAETEETHREALTRHTVEERLACDCTIQHGIANDDVVDCAAAELRIRTHDDAATGQTFADIVVTFADQIQRYAEGRLRPVYFYADELKGHVERMYRPGG